MRKVEEQERFVMIEAWSESYYAAVFGEGKE
jgi:hypothetical protein